MFDDERQIDRVQELLRGSRRHGHLLDPELERAVTRPRSATTSRRQSWRRPTVAGTPMLKRAGHRRRAT